MTDKLYTYNQNCVQAGRKCWPDRNGDVPQDDVTEWTTLTAREELAAIAAMKHPGPYFWTLEKTLQEFLA